MDARQIGLTRPEGRDRFRALVPKDQRKAKVVEVSQLFRQLRDACPDIDIEDPRMLATFLEGLWVGAGLLVAYPDIMQVILAVIADGLDLVDALEAEVPNFMPD